MIGGSEPELTARARAFDAGVFERGAEEVVRTDGATVISTPSLPTVPHLNAVVVHGALDGAAVQALVDQHHGGLPTHRVVVHDEAAGERLAAELPARGWSAMTVGLSAAFSAVGYPTGRPQQPRRKESDTSCASNLHSRAFAVGEPNQREEKRLSKP